VSGDGVVAMVAVCLVAVRFRVYCVCNAKTPECLNSWPG
jgi:hypothetical protein